MSFQIDDRVRILDPRNVHHLETAVVAAISPSGRVQVVVDSDGIVELFSTTDLLQVKS